MSDRIADGIFGAELEVEATEEGLEFGSGYSTLSWDWIERARKALIGADASSQSGGESPTSSCASEVRT